jgi:L-fucose isomerase-like protein
MGTRQTPLLGLCPIGKFVFSHEDAMRQKRAIQQKLDAWNVEYCDLDSVIPDGMVRDQKHVDPVVEHFKAEKIGALFVPHCNFGTEGAVGMIAKKLGVPVLLWGPRDESPLQDGSRYRDSLCGMFASSKVLTKLHVPFTYIENCRLEDETFESGFFTFLRASRVVHALGNLKIAQIGVRVDFFWTTIDNESELLEKFGVEVLPVDMADFIHNVLNRAEKNEKGYLTELRQMESWLDTSALKKPDGLVNSLAMRDELFQLGEEESISAFSIKSFSSIADNLGAGMGLCDLLVQERYPIAAESDIHGAVSSVLLEAASNDTGPSFFPEFTMRHPENDNAVLLWHASAPLSLRHRDDQTVSFRPPWILKDLPDAYPQFRLRDGPLTVCRFDGNTGRYVLGVGEGNTTEGPPTREIYAWMEVDKWPAWERTIMQGPYIHHCSAVYDHCADVLVEACKHIPGLEPEVFHGQ